MANTSIPTEREAIPTIGELKDKIVTFFPRLGSKLSDRFQEEDVINGHVIYKTRGGQQELVVEIMADGTTIASINDRVDGSSKKVSKPNYSDALRVLRGTWTEAESDFMPLD